jgi:hypothetical protein
MPHTVASGELAREAKLESNYLQSVLCPFDAFVSSYIRCTHDQWDVRVPFSLLPQNSKIHGGRLYKNRGHVKNSQVWLAFKNG